MFRDSIFPVLLQAAVHVREKKVHKAEVLSRYAEKHPDNSKAVLLALAQIAANANIFRLLLTRCLKYLTSSTCLLQ
jgi:signal recognition particle subunit SRP72